MTAKKNLQSIECQRLTSRNSWADIPTAGGIYLIVNTRTGRAYAGSSSNVRRRLQSHLNNLAAGKHPLRALQKDWNPAAFLVQFRLSCNLTLDEQALINALSTTGRSRLYNRHKTASRPGARAERLRFFTEESTRLAAKPEFAVDSPALWAWRRKHKLVVGLSLTSIMAAACVLWLVIPEATTLERALAGWGALLIAISANQAREWHRRRSPVEIQKARIAEVLLANSHATSRPYSQDAQRLAQTALG